MASLYKRKRSPFWWIKFRDAHGAVQRESTSLKIGRGDDYKRALDLRAEKSLAERAFGAVKSAEFWEQWVPAYMAEQLTGTTHVRYQAAWRTVRQFLTDKQILAPRQLSYARCAEYLDWRKSPNHRQGKRKAGRNTAILELKVLRWVMREAVRRGFSPGNPVRELVLKREPRKLFPEYTREHLEEIAAAIEREDEPLKTMLRHSFLVARYHGVRLRETNVNPMRDVQLWPSDRPGAVNGMEGSIRFFQKGGKIKEKPLHPKLIPLFQDLIAKKQTRLYPPTKWGNLWFRFLGRIGLKDRHPNCCFHSLRVTVKNQLDAAGIPTEIVREYLSHTPQDVHSSYGRFANLDKLRICHAALD